MQKIPSYALTWMFFQQLKAAFLQLAGRVGTTVENTLFGAVAVPAYHTDTVTVPCVSVA